MNDEPKDIPIAVILKQLAESGKELVVKQGELLKVEFSATLREVGSDLRNIVVFSLLAGLSALPFLLFLILSVDKLVGGDLWLSSLIVMILWGGAWSGLAFYFYKRFVTKKVNLPVTQNTIGQSTAVVKRKVEEVKDAVTN